MRRETPEQNKRVTHLIHLGFRTKSFMSLLKMLPGIGRKARILSVKYSGAFLKRKSWRRVAYILSSTPCLKPVDNSASNSEFNSILLYFSMPVFVFTPLRAWIWKKAEWCRWLWKSDFLSSHLIHSIFWIDEGTWTVDQSFWFDNIFDLFL